MTLKSSGGISEMEGIVGATAAQLGQCRGSDRQVPVAWFLSRIQTSVPDINRAENEFPVEDHQIVSTASITPYTIPARLNSSFRGDGGVVHDATTLLMSRPFPPASCRSNRTANLGHYHHTFSCRSLSHTIISRAAESLSWPFTVSLRIRYKLSLSQEEGNGGYI